MTLRAGASAAVITPPVGYPMRENGGRTSGIDDDLMTRCLVLEDAHGRSAVVTLDVGGMDSEIAAVTQERVREMLGGEVDDVLVRETGNGCSPELAPHGKAHEMVARYRAYLPDVVAGNVLRASLALRDAAAGTATVHIPNVSCFADGGRGRDGKTASAIERLERTPILAVQDADDQLIAVIVSNACPAVVRAPIGHWTADYPGALCWVLEQSGVETAMFVAAPSAGIAPFDWWDGNPSPSHQSRNSDDAQALALIIATQVAQTMPRIVPRRNVRREHLLGVFADSADRAPVHAARVNHDGVADDSADAHPIQRAASESGIT